MFNCAVCEDSFGPGVKPIIAVTEIRGAAYHNEYFVEDEYGNRQKRAVDSVGTEIVRELKLCEEDAETFGFPRSAPKTAQKPVVETGEKPAPPMATKMATVVVHNTLERTNHKSKRAEADCRLAIPMIKAFVDANPGIDI